MIWRKPPLGEQRSGHRWGLVAFSLQTSHRHSFSGSSNLLHSPTAHLDISLHTLVIKTNAAWNRALTKQIWVDKEEERSQGGGNLGIGKTPTQIIIQWDSSGTIRPSSPATWWWCKSGLEQGTSYWKRSTSQETKHIWKCPMVWIDDFIEHSRGLVKMGNLLYCNTQKPEVVQGTDK